MGPPGAPFRLGPGAKYPSCPPPVGGPGQEVRATGSTEDFQIFVTRMKRAKQKT